MLGYERAPTPRPSIEINTIWEPLIKRNDGKSSKAIRKERSQWQQQEDRFNMPNSSLGIVPQYISLKD